MKILLLDDEPYTMDDHIFFLRKENNVEVISTSRLADAVGLLEMSFVATDCTEKFDFVLIDLMINTGNIPNILLPFYNEVESKINNKGQALGQWLWREKGAHVVKDNPVHCYFSSVPSTHSRSKLDIMQEFMPDGGLYLSDDKLKKFILSKAEIRPSKLFFTLKLVEGYWADLRKQ